MRRYLLVALLLTLGPISCHGSTSSTLLKRALQSTAKTARQHHHSRQALSRGVQQVATRLRQRSAVVASSAAAATVSPLLTTVTAPSPVAGAGRTLARRTAVRTGFRQFSQRATRLQQEVSQSFSVRAIFSDVITNHPGQQQKQATSQVLSATEDSATEDFTHPMTRVTRKRTPFLRTLQTIASGTLHDSWSGFVGGYVLGTATDVSRQIYRTVVSSTVQSAAATTSAAASTTGHVLPYNELLQLSQNALHTHSRNTAFALEWARMSAVFGACRLVVQSVRQTHDEWNSVGGSCLAGAVFSILQHTTTPQQYLPAPSVMLQSALLYGGTMWLLHPNLWKPTAQALFLTPTTPITTEQDALDYLGGTNLL
jgi:hypothetical protein